MDAWQFFSGMFSVLMIEEGDALHDFAQSDFAFRMVYVFISILAFVRNIKWTLIILSAYYILSSFIKPYFGSHFKKKKTEIVEFESI